MDLNNLKYLVVGAGFTGSVIAERIAADCGERVVVVDKRKHIGGNCYSEVDKETGIECHSYGSHIFHTSNEAVWNYINRFATFNNYRHKVLTMHRSKAFLMPINLETINKFYNKNMSPDEARAFIKDEIDREKIANPANLEEKAISLIGRPLYNAFIRGYTWKQWEADPKTLSSDIITRLPMRYHYKTDYFNDTWQGIPLEGYQRTFAKMLNHSKIDIYLDTDFYAIRHLIPENCRVVFSGPIDHFFEYRFGELGWRTLRFEKEIHRVKDFQGTSVMNFADIEVPYTRTHEFRYFHDERDYPDNKTVIFREYSTGIDAAANPFYPINTVSDLEKLRLYEKEAKKHPNLIFCGRQGGYRYLDMDKAIGDAFAVYKERIMLQAYG